jgi:hypothetical protein
MKKITILHITIPRKTTTVHELLPKSGNTVSGIDAQFALALSNQTNKTKTVLLTLGDLGFLIEDAA